MLVDASFVRRKLGAATMPVDAKGMAFLAKRVRLLLCHASLTYGESLTNI
jgi:hypothetical protein